MSKYPHESGFWHLVSLEQSPAVSVVTLGTQGSSHEYLVASAHMEASATCSAFSRQEKEGYIEYIPVL